MWLGVAMAICPRKLQYRYTGVPAVLKFTIAFENDSSK
jgi:hypothetical protein